MKLPFMNFKVLGPIFQKLLEYLVETAFFCLIYVQVHT